MTIVNPYITFDGNCEEAFNFYKSIFGGEFPYIGRYKDMPENPEFPIPESDKEKIMHMCLPISEETKLMGSDSSSTFGKTTTKGNNFSVSISLDELKEAKRVFNSLSEGGTVTMPFDKTFWGAHFGMFTDKYGINWMVNFMDKSNKPEG